MLDRLEPDDILTLTRVLCLHHLAFGRPLGLEPRDLGIGELDDRVQVLARMPFDHDLELARQNARRVAGRDRGCEPAIVHERPEEPVLLIEPAENLRQDVDRRLIPIPPRYRRPDQLDPGERDVVVQRHMLGPGELRHIRLGPGHRRPRRDRAEVLRDQPLCLRRVEVARDAQARIVRVVVSAEERRDVPETRRRQVGHRADRAVVVRVASRVERFEKCLVRLPVGLVVIVLPPLVLDHVALVIELLLAHDRYEEAHAVRLEPQRQLQRVARHRLVIVRAILPGAAVEIGADPFERAEVLVIVML